MEGETGGERQPIRTPLPTATNAAFVQAGLRTLEWAYPAESPSRARAQWLNDSPSLNYRCGGSTGMASRASPVSRFTR